MKHTSIFLLLLFFSAGCIPLFIGAGAVVGYTLTNDSAIGNVKTEYRTLWDLCLDKLETMEAEILTANESKGTIKARVLEYDLTIRINTINSENQKLIVSARRYLLPKPQFAQKVFFKIIEDL
jgi:hypothetical protein